MTDANDKKSDGRNKKLAELAICLPFLGAIGVGLPVLWGPGATATSTAVTYLFTMWLVLIGLAFILARFMRKTDKDT